MLIRRGKTPRVCRGSRGRDSDGSRCSRAASTASRRVVTRRCRTRFQRARAGRLDRAGLRDVGGEPVRRSGRGRHQSGSERCRDLHDGRRGHSGHRQRRQCECPDLQRIPSRADVPAEGRRHRDRPLQERARRGDGNPLTQNQVEPDGTYLYKFQVTRPGIFWYHPHHHASTNQVFKGLYGAIIVTDPNEAALQASGVLPSAAQTRVLALSDLTVCKAAPTNDTFTFDTTLPHVSGGATPDVQGATPKKLCEEEVFDDEGNPSATPLNAGDVPNIQKGGGSGAVAEGQTVLTNGKNVGARAGSPAAPGALAAGASTLDVRPGQGLRLQI